MRKPLVLLLVLACVIFLPQAAAPWGNAPTHFSLGNDLANNKGYADLLPKSDNHQLFIRASACPDLAWTNTFDTAGLEYVHTMEFAEALFKVAESRPWRVNWGTIARAYVAHLAADDNVHSSFLADGRLADGDLANGEHAAVEVSVDTIIFWKGTPLASPTPPLAWETINVGCDACDPYLFILASRLYRDPTGQAVPAIQWGHMLAAVPELALAISAEYIYHKMKGNTVLSEAYLESVENQEVLPPGGFGFYYLESLEAAADWILVYSH